MPRLTGKPAFYGVLVAVALVANAAGYLLNLWHDETIFDEGVHLFTSFAVVGAIGSTLMRRDPDALGRSAMWKLLLLGVALGLAWEGFEWAIGIVGGLHDTLMDLLMDGLGSLAAAFLVSRGR